ncbi:hypothetical protein FJ492_26750 [Mesorhizobium sp. B2-5-4]|uniref:hypothetical protein n=1 Tax=Mesorhizobium sp. B2-5-4 TaxID=2589926 RepID=UPI0011292DA3|nr:hypothetical protein [Mesorhizobium sp. B2-5-4]TPK34298.1 hypothetical protein FJ492_26750 [Mesorhizobium sp. B2-5-4]
METYSDIVPGLVDWAVSRPLAILMLSATWPLMLLLSKGRLLGYGALAFFIGVGALIVFGIESPAGAAIVVLAYSLLVSVALISTSRRLAEIENRLASAISVLDDLEVAEERRQTYKARHPSTSRLRRKPAARTMEPVVAGGMTEDLESGTQVIPGPPWQEFQPLDPTVGSAVSALTQPTGSDVLSEEKRRKRLVSS